MKIFDYIIAGVCIVVAFMLWLDLPGLSDTRTILGSVMVLLANLFLARKKGE